MVLSAVYMLWLFQRVFTGPVTHAENRQIPDLTFREQFVLAPLVVLVFWFGCFVKPWTDFLAAPVTALVRAFEPRVGPSPDTPPAPPVAFSNLSDRSVRSDGGGGRP
jgi:NADH-quinone oxidoreductase subunit M